MEIEQKERERIELCANAFSDQRIENDYTSFIEGSENEHEHLQKEVIQPKDKRISELEAEIKALRERLNAFIQNTTEWS